MPPLSATANSTVLVIGGRSYIGARLAAALGRQQPDIIAVSSGECDLERPEEVQAFFRRLAGGPYTVVMLAVINKQRDNSFDAFLRNSRMIKHLMDGLERLTLNGLLYCSSVDVYGRRPVLPLTEASRLEPDTWYGMAKCVGEWTVTSGAAGRYPVTIVRLPGVYGPGPNDRSVIGRFVQRLAHGQPIELEGGGTALRDYVLIDDVCALIDRLRLLKPGGVFNIATGESAPVRQIVEWVADALEVTPHVVPMPANAARQFDLVFDTRKLAGACPEIRLTPMREGIRLYLSPSHV